MPRIDSKVPKNENPTTETSSDVMDKLFKAHNRKKLEQEHEKKRQRKHDYLVAIFSAIASAVLTNIDRIIKFITELISLLADFLLHQ